MGVSGAAGVPEAHGRAVISLVLSKKESLKVFYARGNSLLFITPAVKTSFFP